MKIGIQMLFQNPGTMTDAELYVRELKVAELAEPLGFDTLWSVEHHFDDYSMCPDNMQFLSWLAGRTSRVGLGTAAVILPWNNPLRVVEKMILLDHLSNGRAVFGMGRGLAKMEYRGMMIDMNEARERFDESAKMILAGLESGYVEGNGRFYKQTRTEVRPRPATELRRQNLLRRDVPRLGARGRRAEGGDDGVLAVQRRDREADVRHVSGALREVSRCGGAAAALRGLHVLRRGRRAGRREIRKNIAAYLKTVFEHYEMFAEHFGKARGYEAYAKSTEMMKAAGLEKTLETYVEAQAWGTPQQILDRLERRRAILGDFEINICPSFSALTFEEIERSLGLFARKVMPELRDWDVRSTARRDESTAAAAAK